MAAIVVLMSSAVAVLTLAAFKGQSTQRTNFTEIDVERINIVEPDGKLRMVISKKTATSMA